MGTEKFCLRWNDYEANVSGSFRELRAQSDFYDVTLACDESHGRTLQAHKVILAACSPFFKQMLRSHWQSSPGHSPTPLIYLRGVKYCDLEAILDFMYLGEVNVPQEELDAFMAVAADLQVKGLAEGQMGPGMRTTKTLRKVPDPPALKRPRMETSASSSANTVPTDDYGGFDDYGGGGDDDDDDFGDSMLREGSHHAGGPTAGPDPLPGHMIKRRPGRPPSTGDSTKYQCPDCPKSFCSPDSVRRHFDCAHRVGADAMPPVQCHLCPKIIKNKFAFKTHLRRIHNLTGMKSVRMKSEPGGPATGVAGDE